MLGGSEYAGYQSTAINAENSHEKLILFQFHGSLGSQITYLLELVA